MTNFFRSGYSSVRRNLFGCGYLSVQGILSMRVECTYSMDPAGEMQKVVLQLSRKKTRLRAKHMGHMGPRRVVPAPDQVLPPGLLNRRNSCYINCVIQCCFNVCSLRQLCISAFASHGEFCQCESEGNYHG